MAWNDPPKINYDQLNSGGKTFKHRYVSPNLGQVNNMLHQPVMTQQNDQFNYGLNASQQQQQTNNVTMNSAPTVTYPNHHMYQHQQQQSQQPQQMLPQSAPINYIQNQFQNQDYQQQQQPQATPLYHPAPDGTHPSFQSQ